MKDFIIEDTEKYMICLYKVSANSKEEALDLYVNELAGSLEEIWSDYDPDAIDGIRVLETDENGEPKYENKTY